MDCFPTKNIVLSISFLLIGHFSNANQLYYETKMNDVICPGSKSQCPDHTTCCPLQHTSDENYSTDYGCCPLEQATCCSDHIHCCPSGTQCDLTTYTCIQENKLFFKRIHKIFSIETGKNMIEYSNIPEQMSNVHPARKTHHKGDDEDEVICPGSDYKCPANMTCCPLGSDDNQNRRQFTGILKKQNKEHYGCCPGKDAVCCPDKIHCCPAETECNVKERQCVERKEPVPLKKYSAANILRQKWKNFKKNSKLVEKQNPIERCQKRTKDCSREKTSKQYLTIGRESLNMCCPFETGTCCLDGDYCCPTGFRCELANKKCVFQQDGIVLWTKIVATSGGKGKK